MFIDLNVPISHNALPSHQSQPQSKKGKGKQTAPPGAVTYTPAHVSAIEHRIDLLAHLGYTVLAFNQTIQNKIEPKSHVNILDPLLSQLRKRTDVVFLKRLTIVLNEQSEKGFGLTTQNTPLVASYDILSLLPTTLACFSLACLSHTTPSPLTAHIIALPLTLPRLPFHLKHTLVRSALKNGAVFELAYGGALGAEGDAGSGLGEGGSGAKRNWWANTREVVRVTKGKGVLVSGGVVNNADLRSARDVMNLMTVLGLSPDAANHASTKTPQSLILRAQTRRTYRAVFSEPKIVIPNAVPANSLADTQAEVLETETPPAVPATPEQPPPAQAAQTMTQAMLPGNGKKHPRDEGAASQNDHSVADGDKDSACRKKKKKKTKDVPAS